MLDSACPGLVVMAILSLSACAPTTAGSHQGTLVERKVYSEWAREDRYAFKAKVSFAAGNSETRATFRSLDQRVEYTVTWPKLAPPYPKIDPEQTYDIEWLESVVGPKAGEMRSHGLLRMSGGGKTVYDASRCPVHHTAMERQVERPINGGDYPDSYYRRQERLFPNDGYYYCGCASGVSHLVWRCPDCRKTADRWARQHGIGS